jgi:hypothetical protein
LFRVLLEQVFTEVLDQLLTLVVKRPMLKHRCNSGVVKRLGTEWTGGGVGKSAHDFFSNVLHI